MTEKQQEEIKALRQAGLGYKKIAAALSLSESTIKSYCIRNKLKAGSDQTVCLKCGQPITQPTGQKGKKFCSDACRMAWWNSHQDTVQRKAIYEYECPNCHRSFTAYGNSHRKYCSRACAVEARFRKGGDADA